MDNNPSSSVERALKVLEALLQQPSGLSAAQLLERAGGSRSALYGLLNGLKQSGWVRAGERRGLLLPGARLLALRSAPPAVPVDLNLAYYYLPYQPEPRLDLRPARALSEDELEAFLQGPWAARLACLRPDGRPHVIPVWQEWRDGAFLLLAWRGSQWAEYLSRDASISLTVDEPWPPLRRVVCRGSAQPVAASQAQLAALAERMARRYLGQVPAGLPAQVQAAFRVVPEALRGWQGL